MFSWLRLCQCHVSPVVTIALLLLARGHIVDHWMICCKSWNTDLLMSTKLLQFSQTECSCVSVPMAPTQASWYHASTTLVLLYLCHFRTQAVMVSRRVCSSQLLVMSILANSSIASRLSLMTTYSIWTIQSSTCAHTHTVCMILLVPRCTQWLVRDM